jgi:Z1 domain
VDDFFPVFADWARKHGLDKAVETFRGRFAGEEVYAWEREYQDRAQKIRLGVPPMVIAIPGTEGWYPGPQVDDEYWPAMERYLLDQLSWPEERLEPLDHASSKVIAYTDPVNLETFRTKGLVVGYVQSGKTTNFTAVIAKAADVGYRLIVVLSGIHNGLRRQTQERLLEQMVRPCRDDAWFPLTKPEQDFIAPTPNAAPFFQRHGGVPVLCVVKKNATVLRRLTRWLAPAARSGFLRNIPALFVDDEADQASIATAKINPLIRDLLQMFPKRAYIGYTATPFANVLVDPAAKDLYPESFILNLPRPRDEDGYFGTERIFGRDEVEGDAVGAELDGYDMVRRVPDDTVDNLRPHGRGADSSFDPKITTELWNAVHYFWMATAARHARGDSGHSTMLIHTSMKTNVHELFKAPLESLREAALLRIEEGSGPWRARLRGLWEAEAARVPASSFGNPAVTFDELSEHLPTVLGACRVVLDNYRSRDRLDYTGEEPVVAVAVGGNTLSRGLTLEGLTVSFFVRSATTYDTLLQMGRWFGYRRGYDDLPRIWMTDQLRSWFRHLATVEHEVRLDIERYEEQGLRPTDVGVRIRTHPILNVTAKMGAAKIAYASYGGRRVQTRYFRENVESWLQGNIDAGRRLVDSACADGAHVDRKDADVVVLRDVDVRHVLAFLQAYRVHEDSPDLEPRLLSDYIRRENRRDDSSLITWSVALMGADPTSSKNRVDFGRNLVMGTVVRSKLMGTGGDKADIKTLMSKEHRVVDLDIDPAEARRQSEAQLVDARNQAGHYARRGLLLLYPIDGHSEPEPANKATRSPLEAPMHVLGLALVFPGDAGDKDKVENTYVQVDVSGVDPAEYAESQQILDGQEDLS